MVRLRLLLVCLLMFALPLQGFAAASMLFCAVETVHVGAAPASSAAPMQEAAATMHHHAGSATAAGDGHRAGASAVHAHPQSGKSAGGDSAHACGACAACCQSVAISQSVAVVSLPPVTTPASSEAPSRFDTRPALVPDKPPRG